MVPPMSAAQTVGLCVQASAFSSQASSVHPLLSLQSGGAPATHPDVGLHVSTPLQNWPSSQTGGVPGWQPDAGLHVSTPLQALPSLQLTAEPEQVPPVQTSLLVQALPSLQIVPF